MTTHDPSPSGPSGPSRHELEWSDDLMRSLLDRAASALAAALRSEPVPTDPPPSAPLGEVRGVFVTLRRDGELAGCIGNALGREPVWEAVAELACAAAFEDPRFDALVPEDLPRIEIEVSILSPLIEARAETFRPGMDGLLLSSARGSGLLLPQVATEHELGREAFLDALCRKAGLDPGAWRPGSPNEVTLESFTVQASVAPWKDLDPEARKRGGEANAP